MESRCIEVHSGTEGRHITHVSHLMASQQYHKLSMWCVERGRGGDVRVKGVEMSHTTAPPPGMLVSGGVAEDALMVARSEIQVKSTLSAATCYDLSMPKHLTNGAQGSGCNEHMSYRLYGTMHPVYRGKPKQAGWP
jgi:hypothetical protein